MTRNRLLTAAVFLSLIALGLTVLSAANHSVGTGANSSVPQAKPPSVTVVFGTVETEQGQIPLFPENFPQPCKVTKVLVKEGEEVKKGQVLLEADTEAADLGIDKAKIELNQAEHGLEAAQAKLSQAQQLETIYQYKMASFEKELESKKADLDAAKKKLEGEEERWKKLQRVNVNNNPDLEKPADLQAAELTWDGAAKKWQAAEQDLLAAKAAKPDAKRKEAEAGVKAAQDLKDLAALGVRKAELERRVLSLKAPADGKILSRFVEVGQTMGPQTHQPAFQFNFQGPLQVRVEVDQEWAGRVELGMKAMIEEDFKAGAEWTGKVTKVGDAFMQKRSLSAMPDSFASGEPRFLPCTITIDNSQDLSKLRIGEKVKVRIGIQ